MHVLHYIASRILPLKYEAIHSSYDNDTTYDTMDLQQILNTPQRRLPSKIPETPSPVPLQQSQISI
jgi:hypothetical protein